MDHDHSHHGHGDMDMGPGPMCSMNMCVWSPRCATFVADSNKAVHLGHHQPLYGTSSIHSRRSTDKAAPGIVFRSWRVTGLGSLIFSLLAVIILSAGYEAIKEGARRYELRQVANGVAKDTSLLAAEIRGDDDDDERSSLLRLGGVTGRAQDRQVQLVKAAFYGVQVFYSFFIMLIFMTYNGWVMISVGIGAFIGYLFFGGSTATKSAACH